MSSGIIAASVVERKRILIVSSVSPSVGPAIIAYEKFQALKRAGYDVDILSLEFDERFPEVVGVLNRNKVVSKIQKAILLLRRRIICLRMNQLPGYCFFHRREEFPEVPVRWLLKNIKRQYDLVDIVFWQKMLSFKSIRAIYRKLNCKIRFSCVDFSPMSGGCHFTNGCNRFKTGCGHCPGIQSTKMEDLTSHNVRYRQQVLQEVRPYVSVNDYMYEFFFRQSYLYKDYDRMIRSLSLIDINVYKRKDIEAFRDEYLPGGKTFIIFAGAQSIRDERKGFKYLFEALKILRRKIGEEDAHKVLVITAGRGGKAFAEQAPFDCLDFGYVNTGRLVQLYNVADVFVCPSVNDAGPLMVDYSIACGTPVVAFEMGAALSVVKDRGTGYCARLRDSGDLARGIQRIYEMPEEERVDLSEKCLRFAENNLSEHAFVSNYSHIFDS